MFAVQHANAIARGASAFCLGISVALGKSFIDEEFGNNNAIFRRHEGTQMFKATVLNFIAVVGVLVQANIQRTPRRSPCAESKKHKLTTARPDLHTAFGGTSLHTIARVYVMAWWLLPCALHVHQCATYSSLNKTINDF